MTNTFTGTRPAFVRHISPIYTPFSGTQALFTANASMRVIYLTGPTPRIQQHLGCCICGAYDKQTVFVGRTMMNEDLATQKKIGKNNCQFLPHSVPFAPGCFTARANSINALCFRINGIWVVHPIVHLLNEAV